jgi:protein-L-isoaspartate(D-aspartate) O-methyltransferase
MVLGWQIRVVLGKCSRRGPVAVRGRLEPEPLGTTEAWVMRTIGRRTARATGGRSAGEGRHRRGPGLVALAAITIAAGGCPSACDEEQRSGTSPAAASGEAQASSGSDEARGPTVSGSSSDEPARGAFEEARARMVRTQMRDVDDEAVLDAMRTVPRHEFVPDRLERDAYDDGPLPIGHGQTISQPYIVALMTDLANVGKGDRVLEVGTGSGYQAAVLAELGAEVYSIEIVEALAERARKTLSRLGYEKVHVRHGDGYAGWPEHAPFDAIVVTAAPPEIPKPLEEQLAVGGRLVVPVGERYQELKVIERTDRGYERRTEIPVRFVPMTGTAQERKDERP